MCRGGLIWRRHQQADTDNGEPPSTATSVAWNGKASAVGASAAGGCRHTHPVEYLKKQTPPVGILRIVFGVSDSDHALRGKRLWFRGWYDAVGGGWLLVEMCIVDASILFICEKIWV
jgi:hypothetical protein